MTKCKYKIHFESRLELSPDMSIIETFHDGSQLVRKKGFMIIVDSCNANISNIKVKASLKHFSFS